MGTYVWYLELSREPTHVEQQMRYQNVDFSNGHCLGTIIIFLLKSRDLLCACAVDVWLYLQYYWADLAQTCSLGPLAMSMGVESWGGGTGGRVPRSRKINGGRPPRNDEFNYLFFLTHWKNLHFLPFSK